MKRQQTLKKILAPLLAAALLVLPVNPGKAGAEAVLPLSGSGTVSTYNYFYENYPHLNDRNHVYKTATYEDIVNLFESEGTYAVLVGGTWSEETQANIGFINEVAKENGINVPAIYNFDAKLDGATLDIADSNNPYAYKYVDLVNKYLKNLSLYDKTDREHNVSYVNAAGETVSANKIDAPFLFLYNKDHKDGQGNSAPIVSYLKDGGSWEQFQTSGQLDPAKVDAYKNSVRQVFKAASTYSVINESEYIKSAFNRNYAGENNGNIIFTPEDKNLVLEHVTYHQLKQILASDGNYTLLFGGSWCPNTQAIIKYVNEQAIAHHIDKIYFFDTKLDSGLTVAEPGNNTGTNGRANPHNNNELQIRTSNHPYANLYVDLVDTYLTNIKTENNQAAKPSVISYVNDLNETVTGDRLQVPYLFTYNKDNKDAAGAKAPILGHVELMYSWTNIQPGYVSSGYSDGARYKNAIQALNTLYSRLEAVPAGLYGTADGTIRGANSQLEYKYKSVQDSVYEYQSAAGDTISGLEPGTYLVRYKATAGFQGPIIKPEGTTAIPYAAGEAVEVVVPLPGEQAAPAGLKGLPPTTAVNADGQISGAKGALSAEELQSLEYRLATVTEYTYAKDVLPVHLIPGIYQVRYAAKEGIAASPEASVAVPAFTDRQAAPTGLAGVKPTTWENKDGKITGTTKQLQIKLSTVTEYVYAGDGETTGLIPGVYNVRYPAKEGYAASPAADVVVPGNLQEQTAPTGLAGIAPTSSENKNGVITGTTTALEYKLSTASVYIPATDKEITGLAAGTYNVRTAGKLGYKPSPDTSVVVPAYVPATGSGGGSGGGTPVVPVPSASPAPSATTSGDTVTTVATASVKTDDATGVTTAAVTADAVAGLVSSAKAAEAQGKKAVLEIKIGAGTGTKTTELSIPRSPFNEIASGTNARLTINVENVGQITFDSTAVASISAAADAGTIVIRIAKVSLTEEGKAVLGDRPVYDLTVQAGDSKVAVFGGGKVQLSLPYKLQAGEEANSIIVYNITSAGGLDIVRGKYNAAAGAVEFVTTHFSQYIIAYNKVSFADIAATAWYNNAVSFLAAREITSGTAGNSYSPNDNITRGQFIVLLLKAYGIAPEAGAEGNFSDAGKTYYSDYLAAAKRLGIASGSGNNEFKPDSYITRQELFTLLYRALDALGELPGKNSGKELTGFSDAADVAGYAQEALNALVERGIVEGDNGRIHPLDPSTRAQAAQVFYNLLSK
ncbi:hypothetical protein H70357_33320 [Paenibacillus sp. FSL H7-0357]|uniref:S-layer homology domain-containing protein n=1 Tax=unclassified Paenibacillus TaxID=185978 RepID=UPI0004F68AB2|nr:S-layer homology domain-containing protein [Paenibacillus sp. FSL H7-0357]AIQ21015.1 hypothetical protein H70357_33320 [Paenibacillus sp. FSL H7-0357]